MEILMALGKDDITKKMSDGSDITQILSHDADWSADIDSIDLCDELSPVLQRSTDGTEPSQ